MSIHTLESIKHRVSANAFDATKTLSKAEIEELVSYALEAPSSFDIQHARFIAVVDQAQKEKLKTLSWNQQKVADAAVVAAEPRVTNVPSTGPNNRPLPAASSGPGTKTAANRAAAGM